MECRGSLGNLPTSWNDPLELYGEYLQELHSVGCNLDNERNSLEELIEKHGARWVWDNRCRLAQAAKALKGYPGK